MSPRYAAVSAPTSGTDSRMNEVGSRSQTVATITYQNFFRRYDKLAGMTGTALTEATEFMKIYELQVVEIGALARDEAYILATPR